MSKVIIISETVQAFLGVCYYKCGPYFQKGGRRLHRVVWSHFNGRIPRGSHVHHRDTDCTNNQPDNLVCATAFDHLSYHGRLRAGEAASLLVEHGRPAAAEWHRSDAGIEWHREHYEQHCRAGMHRRGPAVCDHCRKQYDGYRGSRFCSNACKAAWRRSQRLDDVERRCEGCGGTFFADRFKLGLFCSTKCYQTTKSGKYERAVSTFRCHHCGDGFEATDQRAIWCSNRCKRANDRRKAKGLQPLSGPG